jgi:hypothetical protein
MPDSIPDAYYYIDTRFIDNDLGGMDFLKEQVNSYISTLKCMKLMVTSCVDHNELENLTFCLSKLKSSVVDLNIPALIQVIDKLISGAENDKPKEILTEYLRDFLLVCELVEEDLENFKQNKGILE